MNGLLRGEVTPSPNHKIMFDLLEEKLMNGLLRGEEPPSPNQKKMFDLLEKKLMLGLSDNYDDYAIVSAMNADVKAAEEEVRRQLKEMFKDRWILQGGLAYSSEMENGNTILHIVS